MINFLIKLNTNNCNGFPEYQFIKFPKNIKNFSEGKNSLILFGDPIFPSNKFKDKIAEWDVEILLSSIKGHFYFLKLDPINNNFSAGTSMFNILPLYYYEGKSEILISSNPRYIASLLPDVSINKRFILENILFNYQIFNQSCFKDISLLPANHFLLLHNNKISLIQHTAIESYFVRRPIPWRQAVDDLSDLFIESSKYYFPNETYITSLTGGFDGRTLVSCGLHEGKDFSTYCFGKEGSDDIIIARNLSKNAGLYFENISLDDNYIQNESLSNGLEFINGSNGGAGFARAHYLYSAKQLAGKYKFLLTGNFGSELFRTAHIAGIVISQNLYNLFTAYNYGSAIESIASSKEFEWLNKINFKFEWEELKEDIRNLPCFHPHYGGLTKIEQFYKIVFEEVLRKYFGAEMINQYNYIINRTPYLDFEFITNILKTELAGVYSDFLTHNPIKRFKGQVLYAHIIKKTFLSYSEEMTDKGYTPKDLLNLQGKVKITGSFISKRIRKRFISPPDPFSVRAAFSFNKDFWENLLITPEIFNKQKIKQNIELGNDKNSLFIALSQVWFYNHIR